MRRDRGGTEGEEATQATQATQASQPQCKRVKLTPRPMATVTTGASPPTDGAKEEGPPPPTPKKVSVSNSHTPEQEQKLVEFYASHSLFYNQTLSDFKNRSKKDHLQNKIGKELGLTGKF